jgi:very-short-patch-repair endonuclease
MFKLFRNATSTDIELIKSSKNERAKKRRFNKIFGIGNSLLSVEEYIEKYYPNNDLIKCGFCGSVKKISSFTYKIINGDFYITDVEHDNNLKVCNRPSKEVECPRLQYNTNSKEYVKVAYECKTLEEANIILLERNKSPFYRTNYDSDEEYTKAQSRGRDFYNTEAEYRKIKEKQVYSLSLEGYKERFGKIEGEKRWNEVQKSKDSSSLKHFIDKYGEVEGKKKFDEKTSKTIQTKENFLKRGKTEEDWDNYIRRIKFSRSLEGHIERFGYEEGTRRYNNISERISYANTFDFYKEKYGEEAQKKWKEYLIAIGGNSKTGRASKESMNKLFNDLIKQLPENLDYYIGDGDRKEYFLWDDNIKKISFYDFTIPSLKLIVEYHGSLWHFNENFEYTEDKIGPSIEEMKQKDEYKRQLAVSKGFTIIEVFDTDNIKQKISIILKEINKRLNEKEKYD